MTKPSIAKSVSNLINQYHTRNPFELCDCLGINIYRHNLGALKGYYLYLNNKHNIALNTALSRYEQKIILGHELGHALEHSGISRFFSETSLESGDRIELEANLFCSELLISDKVLLSSVQYNPSLESLCEELCLPDWLIDCKIQMLISKGYTSFNYLYLVKKDSIKRQLQT